MAGRALNIHFNALQPAGPVNTDSSDLGSVFVPRNVLLGKVQDLVQNTRVRATRSY